MTGIVNMIEPGDRDSDFCAYMDDAPVSNIFPEETFENCLSISSLKFSIIKKDNYVSVKKLTFFYIC